MKTRSPFASRYPTTGLMLVWLAMLTTAPAERPQPFRIDVVDEDNGWPVSLVELQTTHGLRFVTDNAGVIACDAPELFGIPTWFTLRSPNYEVKADGFGSRGVKLTPEPGGSATVKVKRTLPAQRLGRLTGAGLFAECQKLGQETDWKDAGVFGCDSIQSIVYRGKKYWMWGDTTMPHYPLGLFHMTGGTTPPQLASYEPPLRPAIDYFRDDNGRPRVLAPLPGSGPTWLSGLTVLPDQTGRERMVATYLKITPPLDAYEAGLAVWNDEKEEFERFKVIWNKEASGSSKKPHLPEGHTVRWKDETGTEWVLFGDPFPDLRCEPRFEAWADPAQWVTLEPQAKVKAVESGEDITPHRGSIMWHPWRRRWVSIFAQQYGKSSFLGEIWYAEADAPTGPWGPAVKVLTHDNYTFYNPYIHPEFTTSESPTLIFEGTYTYTFSGNQRPTPRYDYNQLLYRLDLSETSLAPAQR